MLLPVIFPEKVLLRPIPIEFVPLTVTPEPIARDLDPVDVLLAPIAKPVPEAVLFSPNTIPPFVTVLSLPTVSYTHLTLPTKGAG